MNDDPFFINLTEFDGFKVWEMEGVPIPNNVSYGNARYSGQSYVENLLKVINRRAFLEHEECFKAPFFSIFENSLEKGVEDEGTIQWDDRSFYTRTSWTSYSWKLPPEIKRRLVQIDISKVGEDDQVGKIRIPLKKIAEDGGDILISPRIVSKLNLKNGNIINVKIRFSS